jgi:hypothetical protein
MQPTFRKLEKCGHMPEGPQHDEVRGSRVDPQMDGRHLDGEISGASERRGYHASSVCRRFDLEAVQVYDEFQPYRPKTLEGHGDFKRVYQTSAPLPANSLYGAAGKPASRRLLCLS